MIGGAIQVHRALGPAYSGAVYAAALATELRHDGLIVEPEKPFAIVYRGREVGRGRLDLLVEGRTAVELKAVEALLPIHTAHLVAYLFANDLRLGLLLNFRALVMRDGIRRVLRPSRPATSPTSRAPRAAPSPFPARRRRTSRRRPLAPASRAAAPSTPCRSRPPRTRRALAHRVRRAVGALR